MLGKKVLELNGNAVIGFKQYFDYEAHQKTIVVRAIGTAVKLAKDKIDFDKTNEINQRDSIIITPAKSEVLAPSNFSGLATDTLSPSESELVDESNMPIMNNNNSGISRDPMFLTMTRFPSHTIVGTGGFVCATSIKNLDTDERDFRELWWTEVRDEIKSHARTLNCSFVIGYSERTSIVDDVVLLYCSGSAVNLDIMQLQLAPDLFRGLNIFNSTLLDGSDSGSEKNTRSVKTSGNDQHSLFVKQSEQYKKGNF
jgi:hypothetical protein